MLLVVSAVSVIGIAAAMLFVGLRGRQIDEQPLCRRCGYDLTGRRAQSDGRCPECGADLSRDRAVRVGHRVCRRWPVAFSVLLALLGGAGIVAGHWLRDFDPLPYEPLWLLRSRLGNSQSQRDVVFDEVVRRANRLSSEQLTPFVDKALAIQSQATSNDMAAYRLIEAARRVGRLADDKWARYASQSVSIKLEAHGRFGLTTSFGNGDPLPTTVVFSSIRLAEAGFAVVVTRADLSIDGKPVRARLETGVPDYFQQQVSGGSSPFWLWFVDGPVVLAEETANLTPGLHVIAGSVRLIVSDANSPPKLDGGFMGIPTHPLIAIDLPVATTFNVRSGNPMLRVTPQ